MVGHISSQYNIEYHEIREVGPNNNNNNNNYTHFTTKKNGGRKIKSIYIYIKNILYIHNRIFRNVLETYKMIRK